MNEPSIPAWLADLNPFPVATRRRKLGICPACKVVGHVVIGNRGGHYCAEVDGCRCPAETSPAPMWVQAATEGDE
jgi:hypothetical protein